MVVLPSLVIVISILLDRGIGDPRTSLHPVALLGRFIGWWGKPSRYPARLQRVAGTGLGLLSTVLFAIPFFLVDRYAPALLFLILGSILLKFTIGWRSLEEHVQAVVDALGSGLETGKETVSLLVSRDTAHLDREQVLSAAYESMSENLVDSIIAPLFYFGVGALFGLGLTLAAVYRATNTLDAMLGYRDERVRLGGYPARADDVLGYVPARIGGSLLLLYFAVRGRFRPAWKTLRTEASLRPGYNGGIPMAIMAGGTGVRFEKPGVYRMGTGERTLEQGGKDIVRATRGTVLVFGTLLVIAVCLLRWISNV